MPGRIAFARFIDDWQLVNDALKPLLGRYPHLAEEAEDLEKLIASARDLSTKQERLRAELQQTTHLRLDAEAYGKKLRSRVLAQVKGKLGFDSDELLAFGLTPRRKRGPNRKKGPEVEAVVADGQP